ncbi:MAG: DUF2088 domain-containing protein [Chloroflexi bacterium]|nr:DUF2088 domain-containing protein [Chloroflexota bacterium]
MATWTLQWPSGPLVIDLPATNLRQVVWRRDTPRLGEPVDRVLHAIEHPIGSPPLRDLVRPGMRVSVLITDVHDQLFNTSGVGHALLDHLNRCGIPDRDITLIHAAGLHGHHRAKQKLGDELLGRVTYHEHDPTDETSLRFSGATRAGTPVWINRHAAESDFILGVGGCGPSLFGFQGGAGIILPGISGRDTIRHNHTRMMTSARSLSCWWPGNPQREDVMDTADLVGFRFKIDFTADTVFAGYFREEWPVAVDYVKQHVLTACDPCDVYVLAPANGRELLGALYMGLECGTRIVKPGGVMIAVVSARDHTSAPPRPVAETLHETIYVTEQWNRESGEVDPGVAAHWRKRDQICKEELMKLSLEELSRILTRRLGEPRTTTMVWSHRSCLERTPCYLVTEGLTPEEGQAMGFAFVTRSFDEALDRALSVRGRHAEIVANVAPDNGIPYPSDEY